MLNHCIVENYLDGQTRAARRYVDLVECQTAKNGVKLWRRDGKRTSKRVAEKIATQIKVLQAVFNVPMWKLELGLRADYADFFAEITLRIEFSTPCDGPECYVCRHPDCQTYTIPCETREEAAEIVRFAREIFKDCLAWDGARASARFVDEDGREPLFFVSINDI